MFSGRFLGDVIQLLIGDRFMAGFYKTDNASRKEFLTSLRQAPITRVQFEFRKLRPYYYNPSKASLSQLYGSMETWKPSLRYERLISGYVPTAEKFLAL
jgi:hypothetical protein